MSGTLLAVVVPVLNVLHRAQQGALPQLACAVSTFVQHTQMPCHVLYQSPEGQPGKCEACGASHSAAKRIAATFDIIDI